MKKMIAVLAAMVMLCCCAFASAETLLYATNPEYPPFESMDDNNQVIGYDVDLINAIGEKIGIEFQAEAMAFDAVVSSVQTNPNMIGLSGISITDERKLSVNFSDGYIDAGLVVVMKADAGFKTMDDLKGQLIGVQQGTTSDFKAEEITGQENVMRYATFIDAMLSLQGNKVDAVIVDAPVGQAILASMNDPSLIITDIDLGAADWYGTAVTTATVAPLDEHEAALAALKAEGFLDTLASKYFGSAE